MDGQASVRLRCEATCEANIFVNYMNVFHGLFNENRNISKSDDPETTLTY